MEIPRLSRSNYARLKALQNLRTTQIAPPEAKPGEKMGMETSAYHPNWWAGIPAFQATVRDFPTDALDAVARKWEQLGNYFKSFNPTKAVNPARDEEEETARRALREPGGETNPPAGVGR